MWFIVVELTSNLYWKFPFTALCEHRQYVEFFILRIENSVSIYWRASEVKDIIRVYKF